jgi:hypothetical protein
MAMIRAAKERLNVPYKILPRPSVAGSGVTLAFGTPAPHVGDSLVIEHPVDAEAVFYALKVVLGEGLRLSTTTDNLNAIFAGGIVEVTPEVVEQKVRFG